MKCLKIVRVKLDPGAKEPVRAHDADAGLDIFMPETMPDIREAS